MDCHVSWIGIHGKRTNASSYNWNGREQRTVANTARFSRLAEKPGVFEVISVAHQKNQVSEHRSS